MYSLFHFRLAYLLSAGEFQPHGFCYLWNSRLVWLHVISDLLISLAYFTIPVSLLWIIRKRRDFSFNWMVGLFGLFIIACGTTHLLEVWNLWHAQYWLSGGVKALTAGVSVVTAVLLTRLAPDLVDLPSSVQWITANARLEKELYERRELEVDLRLSEASSRATADLLDLTHDAIMVRTLKNEIVFWNHGAELLYGWRKDEVRGNTTHNLLQTVFPQPLADIEAEILATGYWEGELIHTRRDGTTVIVSSRWAVRHEANQSVSILESNRDITHRRHEEDKFRTLLEAAPDAMVIVNGAGRIQLINSQAEKLFDYPRKELLDQPIETLIPDRFRPEHLIDRAQYSANPHPREMGEGLELFARRRDATEFPVEISLSPIPTFDQTLIAAAVRDVSQRKLVEKTLRDSEERFRVLVSGVQDYAILMLDPHGLVVSWNEGAERIKGYQAKEIVGQHFSRFYTPEDLQSGKPARELGEATELGNTQDEGWRVRKDGSRFWAIVKITALRDARGQLRGFAKVTQDATARKQAEDALREKSLQLARLNAGLVEANKELESFSYSVSHDLRAPLRAIDGFSHALLEDCVDKLDATEANYLKRIQAAADRMGHLIDDLLNLARISRAQMKSQPLDLHTIAASIGEELRAAHPQRQVDLQIAPALSATGDPALLRVVLENLLSNAWKFTSKRPDAQITVGKSIQNEGTVFFVRDNGAGFDPVYADRLFGAFQRLHSAQDFPGTGVGLATVQRIIHRHGGKIWAESALNQGTTFSFTLESAGAASGAPPN